jgi:molecular chaperone HscA
MAQLLQISEPGKGTPEPEEAGNPPAIGIDLGTTNSVVAYSRNAKPETIPDERGKSLVPSIVAYAVDGSAIVGDLAKNLLLDRPDQVVGSIKRLMGRSLDEIKGLAGTLPFEADTGGDDASSMIRLKVSGRSLTPVEISADILRALKERAEDALAGKISQAVVTVPAYFDDAARSATKDAARLAGLDVLRLVNEPTAAALAYGLDKEAEGIYAIYDLGGGTFDVSLLRLEKGVFQVLATGGDAALGGDDFDHALAESFLSARAKRHGPETLTSGEVKTVLMTARIAKECLSGSLDGEWVVDANDKRTLHALDRATFETLVAPLVEKTLTLCRAVLDDAGVAPEQVKGVVLVGGATRIPLVRKKVGSLFGQKPLVDIDPDQVVAMGAALQAEALTRGLDTLLLDVTPLSLGIETMGGLAEKVILRNTPIPVAKAQEFTTFKDGQTAMSVHVVQGEREMADQCRSLAKFDLHGVPAMTAGAARIRVTFSVDADGLLTVSAKEETTGVEQNVAVKPSYGLSEEEMAQMLYDSMQNAASDMTRRLLAEVRTEAERSLNAVRAALAVDADLLSKSEKAEIESVMKSLETEISGADRDAITMASGALEEATKKFAERRMDRGIRGALKGVEIDKLEENSDSEKESVA